MTKTYDGTTSATGTGTVGALAGAGAGESVNSAGSQAFTDKNAGTGNKTVVASGVTIKDAGNHDVTANYNISYVDDIHSTINQATVTAALTGTASKTYDGLTAATLANGNYALSGFMAGEGATVTQTSGTYASPNVSSNTPGSKGVVTASLINTDFTATGSTNLDNYILPVSAAGNIGVITAAPLTIKVNNTSAFVTQDASQAVDLGFTYTGFKNGETASVLGALPTRAYSNGGNNTPAVGTHTGVYSVGNSASVTSGNYAITFQTGDLVVVPADKLLITIGSQTDIYGNRTSTNAGVASTVTAEYCFNQNMACSGANIASLTMTQLSGTQWKASDVTSNYVVFDTTIANGSYSSGGYLATNSYNYTATQITPQSLPNASFVGSASNGGVLTILPKAVTVSAAGVTKTYDGGNSLTGVALTPAGALTGDDVAAQASSGAFSSASAASNISFSVTGLSLTGADAANYSLTSNTASGTGSITAKQLTLTGAAVANKVYDGTTLATLTANGTLTGLVGNETLNLTNEAAAFTTASVGTGKTVNITATLADGTGLASNYTLASTTVYANITASSSGGNNGNNQPIIRPPKPIIPADNQGDSSGGDSGGGSGGAGSGNPYLVLPNTSPKADRCNANNLDACLCEDQPNGAIDNLAICYQPSKAANTPAPKPRKHQQANRKTDIFNNS